MSRIAALALAGLVLTLGASATTEGRPRVRGAVATRFYARNVVMFRSPTRPPPWSG